MPPDRPQHSQHVAALDVVEQLRSERRDRHRSRSPAARLRIVLAWRLLCSNAVSTCSAICLKVMPAACRSARCWRRSSRRSCRGCWPRSEALAELPGLLARGRRIDLLQAAQPHPDLCCRRARTGKPTRRRRAAAGDRGRRRRAGRPAGAYICPRRFAAASADRCGEASSRILRVAMIGRVSVLQIRYRIPGN